MVIKDKTVCFNCLSLVEEPNTCPFCGKKILKDSNLKQEKEHTLRQGNILKNQFLIGNYISSNGLINQYHCLDISQEKHYIISELFPWDLATRSADGITVYSDRSETFNRIRDRFEHRTSEFLKNNFSIIENIYTCFHENNTTYVVTEYYAGKLTTLSDLLKNKTTESTLDLIYKTAQGLNELHRCGFYYGMLDSIYIFNETPLLQLSYPEFSRYTTTKLYNSPYIPPEIFEGAGIGIHSDIYAVCSYLYEYYKKRPLPSADQRISQNSEWLTKQLRKSKCPKNIANEIIKGLDLSDETRNNTLITLLPLLEEDLHAIQKQPAVSPKKVPSVQKTKEHTFSIKPFVIIFFAIVLLFCTILIGDYMKSRQLRAYGESNTPLVEITMPEHTEFTDIATTLKPTPTLEPTPKVTSEPSPVPIYSLTPPTPNKILPSPTLKEKKLKSTKKPKATHKPRVKKKSTAVTTTKPYIPSSPTKTKNPVKPKPTIYVEPGDGTDIEWIN